MLNTLGSGLSRSLARTRALLSSVCLTLAPFSSLMRVGAVSRVETDIMGLIEDPEVHHRRMQHQKQKHSAGHERAGRAMKF